jgi:hypothetical protein
MKSRTSESGWTKVSTVRLCPLLACVVCSLAMWAQSSVPKASQLTRVFNESGWDIPGLKHSHIKPGTTSHSNGAANGFSYQVTVLLPDSDKELAVVPMISVDTTKEEIVYREWKFKVTEIHRFEVDGKPYCYQVSGLIYSENPETRVGGYSGTVDLLYFDQSGTGTWTILDTGGLLLPTVPQPPSWAAKGR